MSRRRSLDDDERALWSNFARSITPLKRRRKTAALKAPAAADASADARPPARVEVRPAASKAKIQPPPAEPPPAPPPLAPLGRRLKQRVARGREPIEARLDLHGYTQAQAHAALLRFLEHAQADDVRTVLVVTGKGRGETKRTAERETGILKRMVPMWLSLPDFRPLVVGFEAAHIGHGGEGALYVRLRRRR